jgi:hypothetical protein
MPSNEQDAFRSCCYSTSASSSGGAHRAAFNDQWTRSIPDPSYSTQVLLPLLPRMECCPFIFSDRGSPPCIRAHRKILDLEQAGASASCDVGSHNVQQAQRPGQQTFSPQCMIKVLVIVSFQPKFHLSTSDDATLVRFGGD